MSLLPAPPPSLFRHRNHHRDRHLSLPSFSLHRRSSRSLSFRLSSFSSIPDEWGDKSGTNPQSESYTNFTGPDPPQEDDEWDPDDNDASIPDEWGEKSGPEPESESKFMGSDPPILEDEWGPDYGGAGADVEVGGGEDKERQNWEVKKCLVDTLYGSGFGFRASAEVRAEVSELVIQLEVANPTLNLIETPELLDGNWVLVYTAASELLPLLAVGSTPLLTVEQISQVIDTTNCTVENSTTLASPFGTSSFSATASFEVRTPSRIQFQFKEASFKPPKINSQINLPESVEIFGQKIPLSPAQQLLNPLQEAAASISRTLYGLPPLKVPLSGEKPESWLLITYLDEDLRISRGDGGSLFVLIREGSPLLEN